MRPGKSRKKVPMQNLTQPFVNLSEANTALLTRFAQSLEMAELANASAQKYVELAQKTIGGATAYEADAELVRRLTENYATFAREHAESLMGIAAQAKAQVTQQVEAAAKMM